PLAEFLDKARATPPEEHAKVTPQQSADALAYILSRSRWAAGPTELSVDASALKGINLDDSLRTRSETKATLPTRSTQEGVFSAAQSKRGATAYTNQCAGCHADSLLGRDVIPPLAGPMFLDHWTGNTANDLTQQIKTTMPQDSPGSLTD